MAKKNEMVDIPMKDEKSETDVAALRERLNGKMVSKWLRPQGLCGPSSNDARTNEGWCRCEVKRLASKGVGACVVHHDGHVAVFKIESGETETVLRVLLQEANVKINEIEKED